MRTAGSLSLKSLKEKKLVLFRTEMDRLLALSILFSCLLVAARMIHTGRSNFLFLTWNLFLAYVPYFISTRLSYWNFTKKGKPLLAFFFLVWLLFIPNSFYITTDLFHLADHLNDRQAPQWFDLALILSFVWNGLFLGILSIRQMEKIVHPTLPAHNELFFLYPVMWLNALGIYIGRYLRYNSWDVITSPFQLFGDITQLILHPLRNQYAWDMIFCFSILMTIMYLMLRKISKALA
ncbi:DUF1361 domain-containing protein [Flavitalea flava]